jgi:hypothetical protein
MVLIPIFVGGGWYPRNSLLLFKGEFGEGMYSFSCGRRERESCYKEGIIMMNTLLMLGWVALIIVSYKVAVAVLIKTDNL